MRKVLSLLASVVVVVPLIVALGADPAQASGGGAATQPIVPVLNLSVQGGPSSDSHAAGVNASGEIVGYSPDEGRDNAPHGFLTDATNTNVTRLDSLGGDADLTFGAAINNGGATAGESTSPGTDNAPLVAVVWDSGGNATDLGTIGNEPCTLNDQQLFICDTSEALGINNTGTAVGVSDFDRGTGGQDHHAFADALATLTMTDLGTLAGGTNSTATGVNDAGMAVGASETTDGGGGLTTHAFIDNLATATMTDIGTLAGGTSSGANAINVHGLVVGSSTVTGGASHPFTFNIATHTMTDLGLPPGASSAGATAVNDDGLVVGNSDAGPWVWDPTSKTFTMIAGGQSATGINNSGEIVGDGLFFGVPGPYLTFVQLSVPNVPTNAHIPTACGSAPTLRWSASTPKPYAPAQAYVVFRNGTMIAKVNGTAFTDFSAIAPATYTVAASNLVGLSGMSNGAPWACLPGITGTVTADGTPIGGVDVRVYDAGTTTFAAKAQTDPGGHYGVPGLAAGSYNVRFSDAAGRVVLAWNGGAASQATAAPVVVTAGTATTVDADLVAAGSISGTVTSSGGPDTGEIVRAYTTGTARLAAKTATTDDGTYTITGLAPGTYQVLFEDPANTFVPVWNSGASTRSTAPPITVTAGATTTGIDTSQTLAATITGTVTGDGAPQGGIAVRVYLAGTGTLAAKTTTAPDGTYSMVTLAADTSYQIRFSDQTNHFALQWAVGATKQSHATTFTLPSGTPTIVNATLVDAPL